MLKCMQGGSLNLEELRPALVALQQAAASAEREKGEPAAREKEHRDLAEKCLKAAIAMDAIEEEEKKRKLLSGGDAPVEIRVALMMARRGRRPEEVAAKWPAAIGPVWRIRIFFTSSNDNVMRSWLRSRPSHDC